ncbi:MAG: type II secretion system inner membrane protein GspF [Gammaproteobacteria bacterium]|nr:type II secretion system inner membrane protein GspF [Gammaproteobacteria bacterium]
MAAYEYLALDDDGRSRKGVLTGDSQRQVRSLLRAQGLQPLEVRGVVEDATRRVRSARGGITPAALALMTRQLATMVRAGMPLEQSLRALGEQVSGRRLQAVVAGVRARITEGAALHEALAEFPAVFPEMYRVMVEAGESSGRLEEVLERLADHTEQSHQLRQRMGLALIYPALITLVAIGVVMALMAYVVPQVVRVFEDTGQTLPLLTRGLIAASAGVRAWGGAAIAVLVAGWAAWRVLLRRPAVRWMRDELALRVPGVGWLVREVQAGRLARTLAILTRSGVPLLDALAIGARMVGSLPLRRATEAAAVAVREGGRFHLALARAGYFPPLLLHMLAAGEDSGELDEMLERAAAHQERELAARAATFAAVVEPLVILVMGGVVLLIVLAILLPIFDMNQLVGR